MKRVGYRGRLFVILLSFALLPSIVLSIAWGGTSWWSLPLVGAACEVERAGKELAGHLKQPAVDAANQVKGAAKESAQSITDTAKSVAHDTADEAKSAAESVKDGVQQTR